MIRAALLGVAALMGSSTGMANAQAARFDNDTSLFSGPTIPEDELATLRGGFRLPNGIDVAITVQTETAINGAVQLRTEFRWDKGAPTHVAYVPKAGTTITASSGASQGASTAPAPVITFDNRNGVRITQGMVAPSISATSGQSSADGASVDGFDVVGPDGMMTGAGVVSINEGARTRTVQLNGQDLQIMHFAGHAFGSAIVNSGNDRAIDTQTSVIIDLRNVTPDLVGSSMMRVLRLGDEAVMARMQ